MAGGLGFVCGGLLIGSLLVVFGFWVCGAGGLLLSGGFWVFVFPMVCVIGLVCICVVWRSGFGDVGLIGAFDW